MKNLVAIVLISLFANLISAQEREEPQILTHSLGMMAGATTGFGFSYRYLPNKIGFQVTAIPIFRGSGGFFSSTGLSLLYKIRSHEKLDVFAYLGNYVIYDRYQYTYYNEFEEASITEVYENFNYNIGLGAGVNIHLWEFLDLSVKAGYGLYNVTMSPRTSLAGGIGLYYRF